MHSPRMHLRNLIIILPLLVGACNTLLEVEDVSSLECHTKSDYQVIMSDSTTILESFQDGGAIPRMRFLLNNASMEIRLYDKLGGHGILNMDGVSQSLTPEDAEFGTCGICVAISVEFNTETGVVNQEFRAFEGKLALRTANSVQLDGSMHDLKFRHVITQSTTTGYMTTELNDGCFITVHDIEFNKMYDDSPVAP